MSYTRTMAARQRVTVHDVARVAGVAVSTVSKALNGSDEVSTATQERVKQIAARIGYRPNALARGLRAGTSRSLGAVTDDDEGVFSTLLMRSLEQHAAPRGYSIFLSNSLGEYDRERKQVEALMEKQVDGLAIMDGVVRPRGAPAAYTGATPVVYLYCFSDQLEVPSVIPDDQAAGLIATQHLLDRGRRRIAFLSGPTSGPAAFLASHRRRDGYLAAHAKAGVTVAGTLGREAEWDARSGYQAMSRLLDETRDIDAVVCVNDYVAVGAIEATRLAGLRVPEDIAVVGFDNRLIASGLSVPLTTVAADHSEMGRIAFEKLLAAINGEPQQKELIEVPPHLQIRASSG